MKFNSISIMAIFVLLVCPVTANAVSREVLEEHVTYEAVKGDYIEKIAGITGVEVKYLLEQNPEYKRKKFLHPGDRFSALRRTIVPDKVSGRYAYKHTGQDALPIQGRESCSALPGRVLG